MKEGVVNGAYKNCLRGAGMRFLCLHSQSDWMPDISRRTEVVFSPLHHDMYLRQLHTSLEMADRTSFFHVCGQCLWCVLQWFTYWPLVMLRSLWIAFYAYSARYALTVCIKMKAVLPCCVTRATMAASWEGWRHTVRRKLGGSSLQMIAKVIVVWLGKERVSMMFRAQFLVS